MSGRAAIFGVIVGLALATAIAVVGLLVPRDPLEPYLSRAPSPPPITVKIRTNAGPVRVFPGQLGCLLILPDGTLWRWGQPGGYRFSRTNVPEEVTTNIGWVQASAGNGACVAVSANGGFWSWGIDFGAPLVSSTPSGNWIPAPKQVGVGQDWVSVTAGGDHAVALKRDGTIWGWGYDSEGQLGNGLGPEETNWLRFGPYRLAHVRTNLVQVGTNHSWRALSAEGSCTVALRADGTLWVWGRIERLFNGQPGGILAVPTRVCSETNWQSFQWMGSQVLALNRKGELWRLFRAAPQPSAPVAAIGELFVSNCVTGRFALAGLGLCQLRADGTLWETRLVVLPAAGGYRPLNRWHRVGRRSDWVALWSGVGTAFGLTADGTLWTWGTDWGQEGITPLSSKIHLLENRVRSWLGLPPWAYSTGGFIPIQKEPRPLLRIETNSAAAGGKPLAVTLNEE